MKIIKPNPLQRLLSGTIFVGLCNRRLKLPAKDWLIVGVAFVDGAYGESDVVLVVMR